VTEQAGKLDVSWTKTAGSAMAALSSAVLLSTLGAAGTLVGAAVGSIVVTVGGSVYSHYLSVSRERMAAARSTALRRASRTRGGSGSAPIGGTEAVTRTIAASPEKFPLLAGTVKGGVSPRGVSPGPAVPDTGKPRLIDGNLPGTRPSLRQMLRGLRWKPALAASAGIFVLVMGVILSMEMATGRALSSYTGGSSADGPSTSLALLSSTSSDTGGSDSATSDTADRNTDTTAGDSSSETARSQSTGDTTGSTTGSDTDAPQTDTSTTGPDTGATPEPTPEPTPEESTEPAPEPTVAPTVQAPAEAPAPSSDAGVNNAEVAPGP